MQSPKTESASRCHFKQLQFAKLRVLISLPQKDTAIIENVQFSISFYRLISSAHPMKLLFVGNATKAVDD